MRYETSIDLEGGTLTSEMVKQLVYVNVLTMDRYLPGLVAIAEQTLMPKKRSPSSNLNLNVIVQPPSNTYPATACRWRAIAEQHLDDKETIALVESEP